MCQKVQKVKHWGGQGVSTPNLGSQIPLEVELSSGLYTASWDRALHIHPHHLNMT